MDYTQEQINAMRPHVDELRPLEKYFDTAVNQNYCRCPKPEELRLIHAVLTSTTGDTRRLNSGCQQCIFNLVRDCGGLYYKTIETPAAAAKKPRTRKTTKK